MARKEMVVIVAAAKKRRAKYLVEFDVSEMTLVKFAKKYKMSGERMGQLIKKARLESKNEKMSNL